MTAILTRAVVFGMAALSAQCAQTPEVVNSQTSDYTYVLMTDLLRPRAQDDGRRIRISGWCHFEFEGKFLYLDESALRDRDSSKGLWLEVGWPVPEAVMALNDRYVVVDATFDSIGPDGPLQPRRLIEVSSIRPTTPSAERGHRIKAFENP